MTAPGFSPLPDLEFSEPSVVRRRQDELLRRHLAYCAERSPFYRERLKHLDLDSIPLEKLPLTDKSDVSRRNADFFATPPEETADISFTSGTTGRPIRVPYTARDLERLAYNERQSFASCGVSPSDVVLLTCTMDRCFVAGLAYFLGIRAIGATAVRNGVATLESHLDLLENVAPTVLVGVPSFLLKLAELAEKRGLRPAGSPVRRLVCIGEPLREAGLRPRRLLERLEAAWGAKAHSTYASTETATTFCECTAQRGGHLHPDLALIEILDENGSPLPAGKEGEVVVTPLGVEGMPLIRYRTGDVASLEIEPCSCGRTSPRLGPILGRKGHMLKIRGTTLYPQAVHAALDEIAGVRERYLRVRSAGNALSDALTVFLSVEEDGPDASAIERALAARLRVRPEVVVRPHAEIQRVVFDPRFRKPVRFLDERRNDASAELNPARREKAPGADR